MDEPKERPIQKGLEGEHGVLADVPAGTLNEVSDFRGVGGTSTGRQQL